jgi:hypothetical protein
MTKTTHQATHVRKQPRRNVVYRKGITYVTGRITDEQAKRILARWKWTESVWVNKTAYHCGVHDVLARVHAQLTTSGVHFDTYAPSHITTNPRTKEDGVLFILVHAFNNLQPC